MEAVHTSEQAVPRVIATEEITDDTILTRHILRLI